MASCGLVVLEYKDLVEGVDLSDKLYQAYGPNGLGALTIRGIPGYSKLRADLLPLSRQLAHLPPADLAELEDSKSMWNTGWSFGKEKLGDEPDTNKGSFYGNPLYDFPANSIEQANKFPFFYPPNIWPSKAIPALEPAFKDMGSCMVAVTTLLSSHIDKLSLARVPGYTPRLLQSCLAETRKVKGRLLYYFPKAREGNDSELNVVKEDGWIGWHNDSGFLTALTSAMFFDDTTGEVVSDPDPLGGLWIMDRNSNPVRVEIPEDHLAIQVGECTQIITGGLLVATPHCVRPSKCPKGRSIARGTFPVFVDTDIDFKLSIPSGKTRDDVFHRTIVSPVPPLEDRWAEDGMTFVDFLEITFEKYYEWNHKE